jgi:uncharacterized protein YndB with AHSA1/START domain
MAMANDSLEPVRKQVEVPLAPAAAFDLFTLNMESWWPFDSHSVFEDKKHSFVFECRPGGCLIETGPGGEQSVWGTVQLFDPPNQVGFTWHPGRAPENAQNVTVTFSPTDVGTLVVLVHDGWSSLGDRAAEIRAEYHTGWDFVFVDRYGAAAGSAVTR